MTKKDKKPFEIDGEMNPVEDEAIMSPQADFFAGLVLFGIAVFTFSESFKMPSFGDPEEAAYNTPGLTPMVISVCLIVLSAALMMRSRRFINDMAWPRFTAESRRVSACFTLIFAYVLALSAIGYILSTFLVLLAFQIVFAPVRTAKIILIRGVGMSAALTAVLYYIFAVIFIIPLP